MRPKPPAEVPLNKDAGRGDCLRVKLRLEDGEELLFMLDTGRPNTILDKSLEPKLGKRLGTSWCWESFEGGLMKVGLYPAPKLYLGDTLLLTSSRVYTHDLQKLAHGLMGVLGMDCLRHYCVQLDFTRDKMRFLDPDQPGSQDLGKPFPLTILSGLLIARADYFGMGNVWFCPDTGLVGPDAEMRPGLFRRELRQHPTVWTAQVTMSGGRQASMAGFSSGVFGGQAYSNLIYEKWAGCWPYGDLLGLPFLARNLVTFNFPKRTMYLKQVSVDPIDPGCFLIVDAAEFLGSLKEKGRLPGLSKGEKAEGSVQTPEKTMPTTYPVSFTFSLQKKGDASSCHYAVVQATRDGDWKLKRAWRTDASGHILKEYPVPEGAKDEWETASPGDVGLDTNLLAELFGRINDHTYKNIHSVLIVKNGKLLVEKYYPGQNSEGRPQAFTRDTLHEMHSATKSVNSILVGIAIDQHLIRGVDEKISNFFPEYSDLFTNKEKDLIRLKDLLSMTAGLSWDEWTHPYTDPRNDAAAMAGRADFFRYVLDRPMETPPGTRFVYNSGISLMLGEILYKASGLKADQFAGRHLFEPLGITNYYWQKAPNGVVNTLGGLSLRPRDMAKIGCLILNGGRWQGKQIVSEKWVAASTRRQVGAGQLPARFLADNYGYQWWLGSFHVAGQVVESFSARGRGGQFIIVFPTLQIVAVFTGWNDNDLMRQPLDMLQRYILPAAMPASARK